MESWNNLYAYCRHVCYLLCWCCLWWSSFFLLLLVPLRLADFGCCNWYYSASVVCVVAICCIFFLLVLVNYFSTVICSSVIGAVSCTVSTWDFITVTLFMLVSNMISFLIFKLDVILGKIEKRVMPQTSFTFYSTYPLSKVVWFCLS